MVMTVQSFEGLLGKYQPLCRLYINFSTFIYDQYCQQKIELNILLLFSLQMDQTFPIKPSLAIRVSLSEITAKFGHVFAVFKIVL